MSVMPGRRGLSRNRDQRFSDLERLFAEIDDAPPTSNTTMRGPFVSSASVIDPGPAGDNVVTRTILLPYLPQLALWLPAALK
jgi:hypothetical protein